MFQALQVRSQRGAINALLKVRPGQSNRPKILRSPAAQRSSSAVPRAERAPSRESRSAASGKSLAGLPTPAAPQTHAFTPRNTSPRRSLLPAARSEGERKQVTVLFADRKGSMDLAEQIDPEEWHKIMERFFAILSQGVHRFEGTINQFTGDGIMALFGAPIAHVDHAQRACYAALHLKDRDQCPSSVGYLFWIDSI
jgi:class 3 adenylate cyclase